MFDFTMPKPDPDKSGKQVTFAGYARIPGLGEEMNPAEGQNAMRASDRAAEKVNDASEAPVKNPKPSMHKHSFSDNP